MKVTGVVVLYNPNHLVVLENIKSYLPYLDKLFLVDNSENDDFKKYINNTKIEYIPLYGNKGIAEALNIGAHKALEDKSEWLLTMDQDSSFFKNNLKKMLNYLIRLKNTKQTDNFQYSKIGLISPFHLTSRTKNNKKNGIEKPLMVMTSGNLINLDVYQKIGGFKSWLFIDTVDFDYCLNLRNHGYEIIQLNEVLLCHDLGAMEKKNFFGRKVYVTNHSPMRRYYITRNRYYINKMYKATWPTYCKLEMYCNFRDFILIWFFEKQKLKKTFAIIQGTVDYLRGKTGAR